MYPKPSLVRSCECSVHTVCSELFTIGLQLLLLVWPQDLHKFVHGAKLQPSTIETADFHKQVSGFLEGLQGRLDAPLEKFPQIVPELSNIIQEIGKLLTASDAVQSRNLKSVEGLRGILEAVKWELSGKSIDRRAIPQWDKGNTSRIMNESTREVMAGIRWGLQEMNHAVREQGLLQEKQFKVLENIASSSQRTATGPQLSYCSGNMTEKETTMTMTTTVTATVDSGGSKGDRLGWL